MISKQTFLLWFAIFLTIAPFFSDAQCIQNACFPWTSGSKDSCVKGGSLNLRFMLDISPEKAWGTSKVRYASYGFCPKVDQLSTITLNESVYYATGYETSEDDDDDDDVEYHFSTGLYKNYLSVYGFGNTNETLFPQKGISNGAVLVAVNGSLSSCGGSDTVAVVSTLALNIGMHKGKFNYVGSSPTGDQKMMNPYYDLAACLDNEVAPDGQDYCAESVTVNIPSGTKQPAKVGFEPTCSNNECLFDSNAICIGDDSTNQNCGYCYQSAGDTILAQIQIWVTYYGTDNTGAALLSGGNSPLRYTRFATDTLAEKFNDKLEALKSGTSS